MATIVIKDLPENMDLDRQAMAAITGGARLRGRPTASARAASRGSRIADKLSGLRADPSPDAKRRPVLSTLFK